MVKESGNEACDTVLLARPLKAAFFGPEASNYRNSGAAGGCRCFFPTMSFRLPESRGRSPLARGSGAAQAPASSSLSSFSLCELCFKIKIWDKFFFLAKRNEGRRSSAALTGMKQNQAE